MKRIAILGAGLTGLTCCYYLSQRNDLQVDLFEKDSKPGGLARGFKEKNWQWDLEESYHHIFTSDKEALDLIKKLQLEIIFKRPITVNFQNNELTQFDSPLSLLTYPYLNYFDKFKTALSLAYLRFNPFWKSLENITAKEWLTKNQGEKAWKVLWERLFVGKFGPDFDKISASWFWARIKKRSASLGYINGGFQALTDKLAEKIKENGGKIYLNSEVQKANYENQKWHLSIMRDGKYDAIVSTLPLPIYLKVFPELPKLYKEKLTKIKHLSALTLILELKKPFLPPLSNGKKPYWVNINDAEFPFLSVVEHTNFINSKYYGGNYLLYIGNYLPQNHPYFKKSKEELFNIYKPFLQKLNPGYNLKPLSCNLFTQHFAQPVVKTNYSKIRPSLTGPLPNLYLGSLASVYPWDRGINYAIEQGKTLSSIFDQLC